MSRTMRIAMGWLLLPVVVGLGMWVYGTAIAPIEGVWLDGGSAQQVGLLLLLIGLGHAALCAWPLVRIYGRAAPAVGFVMIWPVIWQHVGLAFDSTALASVQVFWTAALVSYLVTLFVSIRWVMRRYPRLRRAQAQPSVERLIRQHTRAVLRRQHRTQHS
ncbi:MAG: hypothetical protein VXW65_00590 [Pseudomonadota bacterium]|nr:hypothetical protein [Pseudomonadota bacterium]